MQYPSYNLCYIKAINKVYIYIKKKLNDSSLAKQTNSDHFDSKVAQKCVTSHILATSDAPTPHVKNIFM